MKFLKSTTLLLAATGLAVSQFVPPPTDLLSKVGYANVTVRYKEVPTGICELDPNIKSYSGYADISDTEHIFWWFFEARNKNPREAPLTVWLEGGPGVSSMVGLFLEIGPCMIDASVSLVSNPYSWSNVSNMLFIDQPLSTGFSYTEVINTYYNESISKDVLVLDGVCPNATEIEPWTDPPCSSKSSLTAGKLPNSTDSAAPAFWKTLQGFMGAFPQYSRNGFNLATVSYGGHYGPIFSAYIEDQNAKIEVGDDIGQTIHLDALLVVNGWYA